MSGSPWLGCDTEPLVRAHLSRVVEPGDQRLPQHVEEHGWSGALRALVDGWAPEPWLLRQSRLTSSTVTVVRAAARLGVRVVTPQDEDWPTALDDLDAAGLVSPACLWVRGRLPGRRAVAVVGARACSAYGEHLAAELCTPLVADGWCVVSGAAYGIDAAAHEAALAAALTSAPPTLAVLARGVERAYPAGNERLLAEILRLGGGLAAELPPGARPTRWRFLSRNRLIAALGAATVVVEAAARSGALNTARTAAGLSRPVGAVPGPVTSATSVGCHDLLREGVAVCVCDAQQVGELLGPLTVAGSPSAADPGGTGGEAGRRVVELLRADRALSLHDAVAATGLSARSSAAALTALTAAGRALQDADGGWRAPLGSNPSDALG